MPGGAPLRVVDLIRLKEADVKKFFEPRIFERGIRYFEEGRVLRPVVYKKSLMAECRGTQPVNYSIHIEAEEGNIVASCTCPYASGNCKHIAAVLYAWLKNPSMFADLGQAEELLKRQEKSALVEMVIDMVRYDPSVIYVINLRLLPAEDVPAFVRREMGMIFSGETVDYLNVRETVRKLDIFREYASDLQDRKNSDMAMKITIPIIEAIISNYTSMDDSSGIMHNFFKELMDLYGNIVPSYRLVGDRRRFLTRALDWYMSAEWGLVEILHDSLRKEAERLKESRFLTYTAELKLGDYQQTLQRVNTNYSEEQDYLNERVRRLNTLISGLGPARMSA
jgi:hypothetical protein